MNEELKNRILNALTDYADTLDSLANIYSIYGNESSLVDTVNMIDTLIVDVRKVDNEKTEVKSTPVGRPAQVTCEGLSYTTYADFFRENLIEQQYTLRYDYGYSANEDNSYVVVGEGYHSLTNKKIYVLQNTDTSRVYLVEESGVKLL